MTERVGAHAGGCWFCEIKDDDLSFSREFDTYVHKACILRERQLMPENFEAQIMYDELFS